MQRAMHVHQTMSGHPHGHRGKGPSGYQRSDERIREIVCEVLTDDDRIDATHLEVTVKNGDFAISQTSGTIKATVKGRRDGGVPKVTEIRIADGATTVSATDLDHVPERYRPMVTRMIESVR